MQRLGLATSNLPRICQGPSLNHTQKKSGCGHGVGKLPKILRFSFNIYTMAEASDFKFGTQLGFCQTF